MKNRVFAIIPRAGLGNRLFIWAKAKVFSYINQLPLHIIGLNKIHIGPLIRKEKVKRFYVTNFYHGFTLIDNLYFLFYNVIRNKNIVIEPPISMSIDNYKKCSFIFNKIPYHLNYFDELKYYRNIIQKEIFTIASRSTLLNYLKSEVPTIGVHIRMSDFKKVDNIEDIKNNGLARTPIDYFVDCIKEIRKNFKTELPVTIFTDGYENEIEEILKLRNVKLFTTKNDFADLLILSRSKILILSEGSTFSYWAAFLSNAIVIRLDISHNSPLRIEKNLFEGTLEQAIKLISYLQI